MPLSTSYLLSAFADKSCLPALKRIALGRGVLEDGEYMWNRPQQETAQIEELFEQRGIQVDWSDAESEGALEASAYDFEEQRNVID